MDDTTVIIIGGIILMVGLGGIAVLITLARFLIRRSRNGGGNWAWNQLGYRSMGATRYGRGSVSTHYVRTYNNVEVHYLMNVKAGFGKSEYASAWVCPLPVTARSGLQVIEAGIADPSLGARASRAVSPTKYNWEQRFTVGVQTGDTELDERFAIFGTDADAARRFVTEPTVRTILLGLKHVDLTLVESEVRLDDPFLVNSWGLDGQPLVDVHNQVAELLVRMVSTASTS